MDLDEERGCILSLGSRRRDLELIRERRLARNFSLLVPLPHLRAHWIRGHEQRLTNCEADPGAGRARLSWEGLYSAHGTFDIGLTLEVAVAGPEITFH